jgi:hypothetical protein
MRTILIDNYDSYTFNVFHLIGEVNDEEPIVVRNDEVAQDDLAGLQPDTGCTRPRSSRRPRRRRRTVTPSERRVNGAQSSTNGPLHRANGTFAWIPCRAPLPGIRCSDGSEGLE